MGSCDGKLGTLWKAEYIAARIAVPLRMNSTGEYRHYSSLVEETNGACATTHQPHLMRRVTLRLRHEHGFFDWDSLGWMRPTSLCGQPGRRRTLRPLPMCRGSCAFTGCVRRPSHIAWHPLWLTVYIGRMSLEVDLTHEMLFFFPRSCALTKDPWLYANLALKPLSVVEDHSSTSFTPSLQERPSKTQPGKRPLSRFSSILFFLLWYPTSICVCSILRLSSSKRRNIGRTSSTPFCLIDGLK